MPLNLLESETVEFKNRFNEATIETLVAFANTKGGSIYIGVSDDGTVPGLQIGRETFQKWLNEIKHKTQPAIIPTIRELEQDGKKLAVIQVQEFPVKPIAYKGRYYKRSHNSNHQLSAIEIADMSLQSLQLSRDSYPKQGKTIADLSLEKIEKFISRVNKSGRFHLSGNWKVDLQKLKLISEVSITNAAWLLFAREESDYNFHIGRFKTPSLIIDDKMLRNTLFELVEEVMTYIIAHIKVAFKITGITTQREEIFEYPLPALRELVLNAIIHRDFLSPIDWQLKIFDQSIIFYNPGGLFGNLTLEQLKADHYQAQTRNKLIAEAFYLTGDIEKYGSGFIRIRKEIQDYPTMNFSIEEAPNGILTLIAYQQQKTDEGLNEELNEGLNEGLKSLLKAISENEGIQAKQLAELLESRSLKTIERQIARLIKLNFIERKGSRKTGGYYIKE